MVEVIKGKRAINVTGPDVTFIRSRKYTADKFNYNRGNNKKYMIDTCSAYQNHFNWRPRNCQSRERRFNQPRRQSKLIEERNYARKIFAQIRNENHRRFMEDKMEQYKREIDDLTDILHTQERVNKDLLESRIHADEAGTKLDLERQNSKEEVDRMKNDVLSKDAEIIKLKKSLEKQGEELGNYKRQNQEHDTELKTISSIREAKTAEIDRLKKEIKAKDTRI
uniref:Uncharacterized protein n=1 Tax=Arion vulgaris TaxID=1028688 RepID=A0A0B7B4N8_9EUPU